MQTNRRKTRVIKDLLLLIKNIGLVILLPATVTGLINLALIVVSANNFLISKSLSILIIDIILSGMAAYLIGDLVKSNYKWEEIK